VAELAVGPHLVVAPEQVSEAAPLDGLQDLRGRSRQQLQQRCLAHDPALQSALLLHEQIRGRSHSILLEGRLGKGVAVIEQHQRHPRRHAASEGERGIPQAGYSRHQPVEVVPDVVGALGEIQHVAHQLPLDLAVVPQPSEVVSRVGNPGPMRPTANFGASLQSDAPRKPGRGIRRQV